jgi:uncharacterized membrane protein YedE/YeeE
MNLPYGSWWQGALALSAVAVGHAWFLARPLGVSGVFTFFVDLGTGGAPSAQAAPGRRAWALHLTFALALFAGAAGAAWVRGAPLLQPSPGELFTGLYGTGAGAWAALLLGGALVGFGTRMAGGCTSGHGLSGVARFQPGSLAATAAFFGTAVAVSFTLSRVLG